MLPIQRMSGESWRFDAPGARGSGGLYRFGLALLLTLGAAGLHAQEATPTQTVASEIEWRIERLAEVGQLDVGATRLLASAPLLELYEKRAFRPLWTDAASLNDLMRGLATTWSDGLDPKNYHLVSIQSRTALANPSASAAAELDLLASDALMRAAHDLAFGRVEPSGPTSGREAPSPFAGSHLPQDLESVVAGGHIQEALQEQRPSHFVYRGLLRALAELRTVQAGGGWEPIPAGPTLHPDSVDARVTSLRRRLAQEGDLAAQNVRDDPSYDAEVQAAVRSFQHRHGLNEDGIVGAATVAELNVPVETRIDQIRVNLERARWITHELPSTFVAVNVAGAKVYLVRDGTVAFETRAIVGKDYTRTPVFAATMQTIDLNPTWTVPPSIVREILAELAKDASYLHEQGIRVLDTQERELNEPGLDLLGYRGRPFPYVLRQDPGPSNPLGQIKFLFPNPYNVYLHDTPSRGLFERQERLFSHGCIRVQDPLTLAALILDDPVQWSREALVSALASTRETVTIPLARPMPVLVLYWTASADFDGDLHFYRDVYERDAALLAALNAP